MKSDFIHPQTIYIIQSVMSTYPLVLRWAGEPGVAVEEGQVVGGVDGVERQLKDLGHGKS